MFDTQAVKSAFGRAAHLYDTQAYLQRQVRARCIALARQHWGEGAQIIDLGCGTGALVQDIRAQRLRWRVTGLDLSYGMCAVARMRQSVANADAAAMPFADGSFDGVFSSLMLQWANAPRSIWREAARILKPGGQVVLSTLVDGTLQELQTAFSTLDDAPHVSSFARTHDVLADAAAEGLSLVLAQQARIVEHYLDAVALMRALQAIGAANKENRRRKGLMTPKQLARVEREYDRCFRQAEGLPATWQALCLVLKKD